MFFKSLDLATIATWIMIIGVAVLIIAAKMPDMSGKKSKKSSHPSTKNTSR